MAKSHNRSAISPANRDSRLRGLLARAPGATGHGPALRFGHAPRLPLHSFSCPVEAPGTDRPGREAAEGAIERTVAPPESRIRVVRPTMGTARGRYLVGGGIRTGSPTRNRVSGYWGFSR